MNNHLEPIILASASPRRRELLSQARIPFEVMASHVPETAHKERPSDLVQDLSRAKADAVAAIYPHRTVLGADTVVALHGKILGKPKDEKDAHRMLAALQGNTHQVYTGVTLLRDGRAHSFYERTEVEFYPMNEAEIADYIATGECMDKAGAYGIQGPFIVHIRKIKGDYSNVVGLPLGHLWHVLTKTHPFYLPINNHAADERN